MYHPDKYQPHNEALNRFCTFFNRASAKLGAFIYMEPSAVENFREDGKIVYTLTGASILYDFERRDQHYNTCGFPFKDFGQFERKILKPEIVLSIQCSKDEKCFCIAWHEDFTKEQIKNIGSRTAAGTKEYTGKRFTMAFKELNYSQMDHFYLMLLKAFSEKTFNATSFGI